MNRPGSIALILLSVATALHMTRHVLGGYEHPESAPPICNHDTFHQELAAQSARLEALEREHADTRVLAAFGGAKMRGPKVLRVVSCDGGAFLEGSFGQRAWRALNQSGLCSPTEDLPKPTVSR